MVIKTRKGIIIFDAMGVVFPFPEGDDVAHGLFAFLEDKGHAFPREKQLHWEKTKGYNQATRGLLSSIEALRFLIPSAEDDELLQLEKEYLASRYFHLDNDFVQTIGSLNTEFLTVMLSNDIPAWSLSLRKRFELDRYFDLFITSGIGNQARKPEKEIYRQLLVAVNSMGYKDKQIFFIDDSLKNLEAVRELNFITIYKILKSNDLVDFMPDYKIMRLSEVPGIVKSTNDSKWG